MAQAERNPGHPARNPLIWISLVVIALVLFILFGGGRGGVQPADSAAGVETPQPVETESTAPPPSDAAPEAETEAEPAQPGQEARDYIAALREQGPPWPFDSVMQKASGYLNEGRLADAWLLYFFAAREGYPEAMMTLAELSDPGLFQPDNSLLDRPDPIQAWKWYSRALEAGFEPARPRLDVLRRWAEQAAARGDLEAQTLMLNFK